MMEGLGLQKMMKAVPSKALVIRINLVFLSFFLIVYAVLLLQPSSSVYFGNAASIVRCSLRECHHKVDKGLKMKVVLEETGANSPQPKANLSKIEMPSFMTEMGGGMKIGIVNMDDLNMSEWSTHSEIVPVKFEVSEYFEWKDLFPEWIDEEETDVATCPEVPMPDFRIYDNMDMIVAKLSCKFPEEGWANKSNV